LIVYRRSLDGIPKTSECGTKLMLSKYKDHNWFGAMYTYAIAWGCLIPYHLEDMRDDVPMKKDIASLYVPSSRVGCLPSCLPTL
jgi:hypothetical protein